MRGARSSNCPDALRQRRTAGRRNPLAAWRTRGRLPYPPTFPDVAYLFGREARTAQRVGRTIAIHDKDEPAGGRSQGADARILRVPDRMTFVGKKYIHGLAVAVRAASTQAVVDIQARPVGPMGNHV